MTMSSDYCRTQIPAAAAAMTGNAALTWTRVAATTRDPGMTGAMNGQPPIAAAATTTGNRATTGNMAKTTGNMAKATTGKTTAALMISSSHRISYRTNTCNLTKMRSMNSYRTTTGNLAKTLTTTSLRRYWMRSQRSTLATWPTRRLATMRTSHRRRRFVEPNAEQANQCSLRSRGTASSRDSSCPMNWT